MTTVEEFKGYVASQIGLSTYISDVFLERAPEVKAHLLSVIIHGLEKPYDIVSYPADWFQAFKERWFPPWLERRFPVKRHVRRFVRFCPHLPGDLQAVHLEFLDAARLNPSGEQLWPLEEEP